MSLQQSSQPKIRFDLAGPNGFQGVSWAPKIISGKITVTDSGYNDFWVAPAGTYITRVFAQIQTALDNTGTVEIGLDDNADALIDAADWTETNADAYVTNVGSSNANFPNGIYLPSGDTIRVTIGGTPTTGEVYFAIEYFEFDAMFADGKHFDIEV